MKRLTAILALGSFLPLTAAAADSTQFIGKLTGNSEVPSISTEGHGRFRAYVAGDGVHYELTYAGLEGGDIAAAHIHLGQQHTNGGIVAWLCSNQSSPPTPASVQPCPVPPGRIVGILTADNVVGPAGQGITAGEFEAMTKALGNGTAYVNVHTAAFPSGEIRASIARVAP